MKEFAYIHEDGQVPESLQDNPFLASFSTEDIDAILISSNLVECNDGDVIIAEGAVETRIYILLAGEIEISKGGKLLASLRKTGDTFGEMAAIDDDARSATATARGKTFCLAVDQAFLQDIMPKEDNPRFYAGLYEAIAKITSARLKAASEEIARLEKLLEEAGIEV